MSQEALARSEAFMRNEAPQLQKDWLRVDSYKAQIEALTMERIGQLHELTMSVFWSHRQPDLELAVRLGKGYLALDEIGRPLASAMSFCSGDDFASLGMMVTTPRLQALGTGGRLLHRVMVDCIGRDLRLSATREGYRLYEGAGFVPVATVYQHHGRARAIRPPEAVPGLVIRPFEPRDMAALLALDAHAFGAVRSRILEALFAVCEVVVAERGQSIEGYAMLRSFGKGRLIGPIVAEQDGVAMHLAAHFIRQFEGEFLRVDRMVESERFAAFLAAAGLGIYDTVTDMRMGRLRRAQTGPLTYGLAMQSLG